MTGKPKKNDVRCKMQIRSNNNFHQLLSEPHLELLKHFFAAKSEVLLS